MKQFISPTAPTEWTLNPTLLTSALHARWPESEVHAVAGQPSNHCLEWVAYPEGRMLTGSLDRTGQVIALDGWLEDCAVFAVWFRFLVPVEQQLAFYDEAYSADVELGTATTAEELIAPFEAHSLSAK